MLLPLLLSYNASLISREQTHDLTQKQKRDYYWWQRRHWPGHCQRICTSRRRHIADITAIAAQILHLLPQPDILVNNAGLGRFVPFMQMDEALFDAHFNLNIKAPYFLTQALLPALMARQGNIINISSYFAQRMLPDRATTAYSASKGALNSFTKALAFEMGASGVRVNAIAPGSVRTPQLQHNIDVMPAEKQRAFARMIKTIYPLGHIGSPEDIGRAAVFLASDHAVWITGAVWAVDGGLTTN